MEPEGYSVPERSTDSASPYLQTIKWKAASCETANYYVSLQAKGTKEWGEQMPEVLNQQEICLLGKPVGKCIRGQAKVLDNPKPVDTKTLKHPLWGVTSKLQKQTAVNSGRSREECRPDVC